MIYISYVLFLLKGRGSLGMFWKLKNLKGDVFIGVIKISEASVTHINWRIKFQLWFYCWVDIVFCSIIILGLKIFGMSHRILCSEKESDYYLLKYIRKGYFWFGVLIWEEYIFITFTFCICLCIRINFCQKWAWDCPWIVFNFWANLRLIVHKKLSL